MRLLLPIALSTSLLSIAVWRVVSVEKERSSNREKGNSNNHLQLLKNLNQKTLIDEQN